MLRITRREFLKYCSIAAGALGLSCSTIMKLEEALAKTGGVPVVWISGAACSGCTTSLLNTIFYTDLADLLLNQIDLKYLDTVMATAGAYVNGVEYPGANSLQVAQDAYNAGGYVLVVEGGIQAGTPTGGAAGEFCRIGDLTGTGDETMLGITRAFAANAVAVLAAGTCSSFGGVPNGRGSVTDCRGLLYQGNSSISATTGEGKGALNDPALGPVITTPVLNISGCPPHPDWIVGTIAHILSTNITLPPVTSYNRPIDYGYKEYQCNAGPCPWRYNNTPNRNNQNSGTDNSTAFPEPDYNARYPLGDSQRLGREKYTSDALGCLGILGCKGRKTKADCSRRRWNADAAEQYGVNWCVGSRGGCHGCTEPTFPDKVGKFFTFA
jgi:hydrogenase small subunit